MNNKKVLVVHYSQTGQLTSVVDSICASLQSGSIEVVHERLQPVKDYPFPWPVWRFFDAFPETVNMEPPALKPFLVDPEQDFDLIIIAYQVWFLSPSLPIVGFLKSATAKKILAERPVITVIACRNMWLMAQEKMKSLLTDLRAYLLDNIVLIDPGSSLVTFITTPRWLLTGNKGKVNGILPPAGVAEQDVINAARFGAAIGQALEGNEEKQRKPLLRGLRAVSVDSRLIASERVGQRSFIIWGKLLRKVGQAGDPRRRPVLIIYMAFLICLIVTVVPLTMLIKVLLRPLLKHKLARQKAYFEQPSGSEGFRMREFYQDA